MEITGDMLTIIGMAAGLAWFIVKLKTSKHESDIQRNAIDINGLGDKTERIRSELRKRDKDIYDHIDMKFKELKDDLKEYIREDVKADIKDLKRTVEKKVGLRTVKLNRENINEGD